MPKPVRLNIPIEAILKRLKGQSILSGATPDMLNRFDSAVQTTGMPPGLRELAARRYMEPQTPTGGASLTPLPMQNPFAPSPEIEMLQNRNILPQPGGIQGELFPLTQVITPPEDPIRGLREKIKKGTEKKPEKYSKEQLRALVERVLNRQVAPAERLGGIERQQAMQTIMAQGIPTETVGMTNLMDLGRTPVTGSPMPTAAVPGGRGLRMPVEEARVLALQNPERFQPGGMTNFMFNPVKEAYSVLPGAAEDIIGGIGLRNIKYEPLWTAPMRSAMEHLGKAEKEAAGYALPKPANVTISIAQGFKVFNNLLRKDRNLLAQWDEIYQTALDTKPHIVQGMDPKEYFVETFSKMLMNRGRWQKNLAQEFKFIGGLGDKMRALIAPEAQLAERVKTKMKIPEEKEKTGFGKPVVQKESSGPSLESTARRNELERSQQSKTFKKFLDNLLKEFNKRGKKPTPMDIKVRWQEYLDSFKKGGEGTTKGLPPLALGAIGGAYGMGD